MASKYEDKRAKSAEPSFAEKTEDFLRKNRGALLALAVLTFVVVVGAVAWTVANGMALEASAAAIEKINKGFEDWYSAEEGKKAELETALLKDIDDTVARHGARYAGLKALLMRGRLHFEKQEYAEAQKAYLELYEKGKKLDLGVAGLRSAASTAMAAGDDAKAIELFSKLVNEYASSDSYAHDAYVLGLLYEDAKDYAKARECYTGLVATKPDDDWTKLARSRIIFMTSNGL